MWICLHPLDVIPEFGLDLPAASISLLFLSCVARVLSTVAHKKFHLRNKQPLVDTAETPCTLFAQPWLCIPAVHGEPTPALGFVSAQESLHQALGVSQKILRMSQQMQLQELDVPGQFALSDTICYLAQADRWRHTCPA